MAVDLIGEKNQVILENVLFKHHGRSYDQRTIARDEKNISQGKISKYDKFIASYLVLMKISTYDTFKANYLVMMK